VDDYACRGNAGSCFVLIKHISNEGSGLLRQEIRLLIFALVVGQRRTLQRERFDLVRKGLRETRIYKMTPMTASARNAMAAPTQPTEVVM
jgi:hypothetical protein